MMLELNIGDSNEKIKIIDKDRLCYQVHLSTNDSIRTISKALVQEFVDYLRIHPDKNAIDIKDAISGKSQIDKFEYGYNSTLFLMAKMVLDQSGQGYKEADRIDFKSSDDSIYRNIVTAIKTKPFILLAGISGTGKSRVVRELARACWEVGSKEYEAPKPQNFEMVQVKPNWHDSSELLGYVSRVSGKPEFVVGDFLRFVVKAWEHPDVPYFLCLDEMNLAPVEQYFAEYLSVLESRKRTEKGYIVTDSIFRNVSEDWYSTLILQLTENEKLRAQFNTKGIGIPENLIVMGTVNMDETTFSFSRKVLDRAMTIEMNDVDLYGGLTPNEDEIGHLTADMLIPTAVEGKDVYAANEAVCNKVLTYLQAVNDKLEGTPFKIAYRTRNEFLLYTVNNLPYKKNAADEDLTEDEVIARALDEITSMKILSRIEGDETKVSRQFLENLKNCIRQELDKVSGAGHEIESISLQKLDEMSERLNSGYTSFWS